MLYLSLENLLNISTNYYININFTPMLFVSIVNYLVTHLSWIYSILLFILLIGRCLITPVDTGRKLNVHKTFRRRPGRLLNVLCTFNLRPVSTGTVLFHFQSIRLLVILYSQVYVLSFRYLLKMHLAQSLREKSRSQFTLYQSPNLLQCFLI